MAFTKTYLVAVTSFCLMNKVSSVTDKQGLFTYVADLPNSPPNWGDIEAIPDNECSGNAQSPIDIVTREVDFSSTGCDEFKDYTFVKGDCTYEQVEFRVSDHNIEVHYEDGCTKDSLIIPDIPDETFELIQFHIHTGTEHSFDGFLNAAEFHLVHKSTGTSGKLAVIGVIIQVGLAQDNAFFRTLLDGWQAVADEIEATCSADANNTTIAASRSGGSDTNGDSLLGIYDLMPKEESFYRYEGSLTTPPCTEIVHWSVASKPIQISTTEEADLVDLMLGYKNPDTCELDTAASSGGSTSRPQQPLNGRTVTLICPTSWDQGSGSGSNMMGTAFASMVVSFSVFVLLLVVG